MRDAGRWVSGATQFVIPFASLGRRRRSRERMNSRLQHHAVRLRGQNVHGPPPVAALAFVRTVGTRPPPDPGEVVFRCLHSLQGHAPEPGHGTSSTRSRRLRSRPAGGGGERGGVRGPANEFATMNPRCRPSPTGPARASAVACGGARYTRNSVAAAAGMASGAAEPIAGIRPRPKRPPDNTVAAIYIHPIGFPSTADFREFRQRRNALKQCRCWTKFDFRR
jgi:hypothetical protein